MDKFRSLKAFVHVVDCHGFAPAARSLGLSTSAVSRQVMELESWLDTQLLNRTTRHVSVTDAGREYLDQCRELISRMDDLEASALDRISKPHGRVRITAPVFMGRHVLGSLLPGFLEHYPDVSIELQLLDRVVNLVDEGFDLALRIGVLPDSTLMARKLGEMKLSLVASPEYLKLRGTPKTVADLEQHNCLLDLTPEHGNLWPIKINNRSSVRVSGNISVNSGELVRDLALSGTGIALLPTFFVEAEIKDKQLVSLLEKHIQLPNATVSLVYPHTTHLSKALRVFIDYVVSNHTKVLGAAWASKGGRSL